MANTEKPRLLFYFLHLLGVGHVYRAKRLIEGLAQAGIAVDVVYGGEPVPCISFEAETVHYLPAIKAGDNAYSFYLDADGNRLGTAFEKLREKALLDIFDTLTPDMILTEAFPFGRRMVRHELAALFETASRRTKPPLIVSSVRDILQERKKPGRNEEVVEWIKGSFDHVIVHSDPEIIELDATFPLTNEIEDKLSYSGFVIPSSQPTAGKSEEAVEAYDVIVSAGGGAFGGPLLTIALEAALNRPNQKWCILTGPNLPTEQAAQLHENAPAHITLKTSVKNLAAHMKQAQISISQCGYNTAMDALSAHRESACRGVFVPYDTEGQSEQLRRAELLEQSGYAISVPQSKLTAEKLLGAIDKAQKLKRVEHEINFDGVKNSAALVKQWIDQSQ